MTKLYLHQKYKCSVTCGKSINVIVHLEIIGGQKYNHLETENVLDKEYNTLSWFKNNN